jgi:hypothetical protein
VQKTASAEQVGSPSETCTSRASAQKVDVDYEVTTTFAASQDDDTRSFLMELPLYRNNQIVGKRL